MNLIRKSPLVCGLLFLMMHSCALQKESKIYSLSKDSKKIPPGTTKINDNLYIDRIPVTNVMYQEFLDQLQNSWSLTKSQNMQSYPSYKLDRELVFESFNGSGILYNDVKYVNKNSMLLTKLNLLNYTKLPIYKYHPAVTMTAEKAALFCKWRTDIANAVYAIKSKNASQRAKFPTRVTYRLPTQNEMLLAQNKLHKEARLFVYQEQLHSFEGNKNLFKDMQDTNALTVYEMYEVASDGVYNPMMSRALRFYNEGDMQTGCRCICEVTP